VTLERLTLAACVLVILLLLVLFFRL